LRAIASAFFNTLVIPPETVGLLNEASIPVFELIVSAARDTYAWNFSEISSVGSNSHPHTLDE
jgi:hypothetical protein